MSIVLCLRLGSLLYGENKASTPVRTTTSKQQVNTPRKLIGYESHLFDNGLDGSSQKSVRSTSLFYCPSQCTVVDSCSPQTKESTRPSIGSNQHASATLNNKVHFKSKVCDSFSSPRATPSRRSSLIRIDAQNSRPDKIMFISKTNDWECCETDQRRN
jgi:hypothetical protein